MHTAVVAGRRATRYLVTHYLLSYLGYYGLISTLVVALTATSFTAGQIAVLVMVFALTNKVTAIPLAPWLDRVPAAYSVLAGCLVAGAAFVALRFATGMPATVACLGLAGAGISINALASKQLGAAASDQVAHRTRLFSFISVGVNVAAAVAAPLALLLVERGQHREVLLSVAALYCVAGVTTFLNRGAVPAGVPDRQSWSVRVYLEVLRAPGVRAFVAVNFFYWFLYGQLFNALAAYVSGTLHEPGRLGWLYTLNAALVVAAQLAVTRAADRWAGDRPLGVVVASYVVFAASFLAVFLVSGYLGAVLFVVLFTLAEMLFVPSGDVLIVGLIRRQNRAVGYGIFAVSTALGEALGGGAGIVAFRWFTDHGHGGGFWLTATALALLFALLTHRLRHASRGLRTATASPV